MSDSHGLIASICAICWCLQGGASSWVRNVHFWVQLFRPFSAGNKSFLFILPYTGHPPEGLTKLPKVGQVHHDQGNPRRGTSSHIYVQTIVMYVWV